LSTQGIRVLKREERAEYVARDVTVRALDCGYCSRDSMTYSREGLISWLSPHGSSPHPNVITVMMLLRKIVPFLGVGVLREMKKLIDEQIEKSTA
jgi:hypothetical protein